MVLFLWARTRWHGPAHRRRAPTEQQLRNAASHLYHGSGLCYDINALCCQLHMQFAAAMQKETMLLII